jgi:lactoylglutathione lyase
MRILHTMLRVGDLDRSIAFSTDVLGMTLVSRSDFPGGRFTLAFVGYVEKDDNVTAATGAVPMIELTHNWDTPSYELGTGFGHVAIEVDDAYVTCDAIRARGGKVVREAGPMQHGTTVIAFAEDPDGYRIELIQRQT